MKEFDCVEVSTEKYAKHGVHVGMQGWICWDECIDTSWLVSFPQYGDKNNIATIGINEEDMKVIPKMDARINEQIKAQFESQSKETKEYSDKADDLSGYLV